MASRYVFKFFGSIGPAGAFVSLTEKICTSVFPDAYNYGDDEQMESEIDKEMKGVREEYIKELFNFKSKFSRRTTDTTQDEKDKAYKDLIFLIKKYIEKMVRLEKNKYMRERIYYQKEKQSVLYEKANAKYQNCRDDITDNLVKQARTICKPSADEFRKHFDIFKLDD